MALVYLIDVKTLQTKGFTHANVEANLITTTLRTVQDTILEPIIGTSLFKRLLQGVEDDDLNANETKLLNDYVVKFLISSVDYHICTHVWMEIRAKGIGTGNDQYVNSTDVKGLSVLKDELAGYENVYKNRLIGYLKDNCDLFPQYKEYVCSFENIPPEKEQKPYVNISFI